MSRPRYAIGIDLGTTNCVLAYVDLAVKHGRVAVLPIPQLQTRDTVAAGPLLPSFYYLGTEAHEPPCIVPGLAATAALGVYARAQLDAVPGRVIHSAKSWLAHGGIDREARLLPFGSEDLPDTDKRSPVEVSAAYLAYLRAAWDATIGQVDPGAAFDRQHLIVTVPASFDEAAQALTRRAAALAGYPDGFRLLEEPQAAFYAWSAGAGAGVVGKATRAWFTERLPGLSEEDQTVLVCDIGGGTTDLSLFRLALDSDAPGEDAGWPDIERLAVSDHLLLGGDNIDLAISHLIERRALGHAIRGSAERRLSRRQWQHLVPQSMLLKERILSGDGPPQEVFHVSIPGEGGGLFASVSSATLTRADLSEVILDGFFPVTEASERPRTRQMGLREIGLPYAVDTAVSRHLAGFLDGQAVDAVLFAGGTLIPSFLQARLLTIVERWQGRRPIGLSLPDLSLAIAEGAAHCAALVAQSRRRIRAGYARSVYLELRRERPEDATELVCILPQGFEEGRSSTLQSRAFDLLLNRPARFTAYSSTHRREDRPGAIVRLDEGVFNPLPPLHTTLTLEEAGFDPRKSEPRSVDVNLEVELSSLGVLQTMLVSEPLGRRWRLDFNLRGAAESRDPSSSIANGPAPGLSDDVMRAGCERITHFYGKKQDLGEKDSAKSLVKDLERTLGQPRTVWSLPLLRGLWPSLYPGMTRRGRSLAHENTWLYLAGFLLRPGYGAELDPWRMSQLWGAWSLGVHHKKEKSAQSNWWMMWRRVAGGLSAEQQRRLFDGLMPQFRKSPVESPEATRLLGALERLPLTTRTELAKSLFELVLRGRAEDQPAVFAALARLCSRVPLYAAADAVLPPALVEDWFERVAGLDWPRQGLKGLASVFSAACRVTGTRALDIHAPVRLRVIEKLKQSGAREADWRVVQEYHEVTGEDRNALFGEELPAGLRLVQ